MTIGESWKGIKKAGGKFVRVAAFEFFVQQYYPQFIQQMRVSLSTLTPKDVTDMIHNNQYPELPAAVYGNMHGYEEYLERITVERLWKAFVRACPQLAAAIDKEDMNGYRWFARFRKRILEGVKKGGELQVSGETNVPITNVTCDKCGKSGIFPKAQAMLFKDCPFCHAPNGDTPPAQAPPDGMY